MNLVALAPMWAVIGLMVLLFLAACQDAARLKISNLLCLAVLALGLATMVVVGIRTEAWQNVVILAASLVVGNFLYASGKIGGGDIKLFAATGFWFDFASIPWLLFAVTLAGGLLAMAVITIRLLDWSEAAQKRVLLLRRRSGIPYAVAIAIGALLVVSFTAFSKAPDPRTNFTVPKVVR